MSDVLLKRHLHLYVLVLSIKMVYYEVIKLSSIIITTCHLASMGSINLEG
jgi:hypothetical protein